MDWFKKISTIEKQYHIRGNIYFVISSIWYYKGDRFYMRRLRKTFGHPISGIKDLYSIWSVNDHHPIRLNLNR